MSAVRTHLHRDLATILVEVLNNRARQLEQHAEVLACATRARATHGRVGEADQLSHAARKVRRNDAQSTNGRKAERAAWASLIPGVRT